MLYRYLQLIITTVWNYYHEITDQEQTENMKLERCQRSQKKHLFQGFALKFACLPHCSDSHIFTQSQLFFLVITWKTSKFLKIKKIKHFNTIFKGYFPFTSYHKILAIFHMLYNPFLRLPYTQQFVPPPLIALPHW